MPSFTTINKLDAEGHVIKYDNYKTEAEARTRVVELHRMGLTDAFYINDETTLVGSHKLFQQSKFWTVNTLTKTVTFNQDAYKAEEEVKAWEEIRRKRNQLLQESDWIDSPNSNINPTEKDKWLTYRKKLRDIPQDFKSPEKIEWPEKP